MINKDEIRKSLVGVLPATREVAVKSLVGRGLTKARANQTIDTALWSGIAISLKGVLSLVAEQKTETQ